MEKNQESQELDLLGDVVKCSEEDPDSEDASCCEPSGSNIDSKNEVDPTEKDSGGDQMNTFEDVQCVEDLSDDEDNDGDTEEMDQEEDDYEIEYDVEEKTNLEFLTTEDQLLDSLSVDDSKNGSKAELGEENMVVAEREPIEFGVLSEFIPVCVVTLDFRCFRQPCHDLRELLKQRLWTQSPEILDQLIILYNLFKSTNTCLQLIDCDGCDGAIQFYVHVYELNAIENFLSKVRSKDFSNILACMLLSHKIREKIKNLKAQFSVTCHCKNLNHWETEYERTSHSFRFYSHVKGSRWARNYTDWPGSSSFNPGSSEGNKVPKVTVLHQRISEDSERCESTNVGQRSTDFDKAAEDATMLDTDNRTFFSSPCSKETSSSEPLIARSSSVDHFSSKCDRSSTTTLNEKEMRRKSF